LITKIIPIYVQNNLLFYGGLFGVFSFLPTACLPTFLAQVLNRVNQKLLAVFILIGFRFIGSIDFLCLPLRKQRLGNEKPILASLGLLLLKYWNWWTGLLLPSGSRAYYVSITC
jgi:hypothetical protein